MWNMNLYDPNKPKTKFSKFNFWFNLRQKFSNESGTESDCYESIGKISFPLNLRALGLADTCIL